MDVFTAVVLTAAFIVKAVDFIRNYAPRIDGVLVQLLAVVMGVGLAFLTGLQGIQVFWSLAELPELAVAIPAVVDIALTGVILGLASGYVSDLRPSKAEIMVASPDVVVNLSEVEPE